MGFFVIFQATLISNLVLHIRQINLTAINLTAMNLTAMNLTAMNNNFFVSASTNEIINQKIDFHNPDKSISIINLAKLSEKISQNTLPFIESNSFLTTITAIRFFFDWKCFLDKSE